MPHTNFSSSRWIQSVDTNPSPFYPGNASDGSLGLEVKGSKESVRYIWTDAKPVEGYKLKNPCGRNERTTDSAARRAFYHTAA